MQLAGLTWQWAGMGCLCPAPSSTPSLQLPSAAPKPSVCLQHCSQAGQGEQAPVQPSWLQTRGQALRSTGTRGQRALGGTRVSWGAVTPYRAGTATRCFYDHLTSPLGLLLFALKPSSRGQAGCMSGLLRWPLRPPASRAGKGPGSAARDQSLSQAAGTAVLSPRSRCQV